jgi:phospholipid N-methyltransferase
MGNFWTAAARNFIQIGGLFPSSRFACRAIVRKFPPHTSIVAEYGPGTGVLTHEILKKLPPTGKLFGIELNTDFVEMLRNTEDQRFQLIAGDVAAVSSRLKELDPRGVDVAVSGIPFSFIPEKVGDTIIANTRAGLNPGGVFVVYQYSRFILKRLRKQFSRVDVSYEPRNIFPYFIMVAHP